MSFKKMMACLSQSLDKSSCSEEHKSFSTGKFWAIKLIPESMEKQHKALVYELGQIFLQLLESHQQSSAPGRELEERQSRFGGGYSSADSNPPLHWLGSWFVVFNCVDFMGMELKPEGLGKRSKYSGRDWILLCCRYPTWLDDTGRVWSQLPHEKSPNFRWTVGNNKYQPVRIQ